MARPIAISTSTQRMTMATTFVQLAAMPMRGPISLVRRTIHDFFGINSPRV
jgi:hypothetical protein